jgi:sortase A
MLHQPTWSATDDATMLLRQMLSTPVSTASNQNAKTSLLQELLAHIPPFASQTDHHAAQALLYQLLSERPPNSHALARPLYLRSLESWRSQALEKYLQPTIFDSMLQRSAYALMLASALTVGYWFADGPLYDWMFKPRTQSQATAATLPRFDPREDLLTTLADRPIRRNSPPSPTMRNGMTTAELANLLPTEPRNSIAQRLPSSTQFSRHYTVVDDYLAAGQRPMARQASNVPDPRPNRLIIPAINLDTTVYEVPIVDDTWANAEYAAGYLQGTGLPGDAGNVGIAGHMGLRGAIFANLHALKPNDQVYVYGGGWRYEYRVNRSFVVWPNEVYVLDPTLDPILTLVTCTNWDLQRLIVVADLVGSVPEY